MLPFLQQTIDARKLLIYSDHSSSHPTNAAELTNTTGKTLDGGPITVYDGGAYGGEALMETLKAGDKRLISYAVDLGTRITTAQFDSSRHRPRNARQPRRPHHQSRRRRNPHLHHPQRRPESQDPDHRAPRAPGLQAAQPQKPSEKTATAYRFEIALAADSTQEFAVPEERVYDQTFSVSNFTPDVLLTYAGNTVLSPAARQGLRQIADQKQQIANNDRAIQEAQTQLTGLTQDEERIRQNIQSLNNVSGQQQQVQNYARQLDQHEQQLAALRDKQADLQKKKTALATELDRQIQALSF